MKGLRMSAMKQSYLQSKTSCFSAHVLAGAWCAGSHAHAALPTTSHTRKPWHCTLSASACAVSRSDQRQGIRDLRWVAAIVKFTASMRVCARRRPSPKPVTSAPVPVSLPGPQALLSIRFKQTYKRLVTNAQEAPPPECTQRIADNRLGTGRHHKHLAPRIQSVPHDMLSRRRHRALPRQVHAALHMVRVRKLRMTERLLVSSLTSVSCRHRTCCIPKQQWEPQARAGP